MLLGHGIGADLVTATGGCIAAPYCSQTPRGCAATSGWRYCDETNVKVNGPGVTSTGLSSDMAKSSMFWSAPGVTPTRPGGRSGCCRTTSAVQTRPIQSKEPL